ncbi:hypothetical protein PMAYCL1PPCAC_01699, partial [Pristionchus mayeri]
QKEDDAAPILILDDAREQKTQENTRALSAFGVPYLAEDKTQPATAKTGMMSDTDQRLRRQKQTKKNWRRRRYAGHQDRTLLLMRSHRWRWEAGQSRRRLIRRLIGSWVSEGWRRSGERPKMK